MNSIIVHKGHVNLLRIFFICEDVRLDKLNTLIMQCNLNLEVVTKVLQQLIPLHVGIKCLSFAREDEKSSEKIDKNSVHYRISVKGSIDSDVTITKYTKKLHD